MDNPKYIDAVSKVFNVREKLTMKCPKPPRRKKQMKKTNESGADDATSVFSTATTVKSDGT